MIPKPIATLVLIELLTGTHYCAVASEKILGQVRLVKTKPVQISQQLQQRHHQLYLIPAAKQSS
jgi:hypothetical protein